MNGRDMEDINRVFALIVAHDHFAHLDLGNGFRPSSSAIEISAPKDACEQLPVGQSASGRRRVLVISRSGRLRLIVRQHIKRRGYACLDYPSPAHSEWRAYNEHPLIPVWPASNPFWFAERWPEQSVDRSGI